MTSTKPEKEFKAGAVRATIWRNDHLSSDGKVFNSRKVVIERIYRDANQNFKTTGSLAVNDIPKAIVVLEKAYEFLICSDGKRNATGFHDADENERDA